MSESLLVPGQPYPGLPGWRDLSEHLANGWALGNARDYLKVLIEGNTQTIRGRVRIGVFRVSPEAGFTQDTGTMIIGFRYPRRAT